MRDVGGLGVGIEYTESMLVTVRGASVDGYAVYGKVGETGIEDFLGDGGGVIVLFGCSFLPGFWDFIHTR